MPVQQTVERLTLLLEAYLLLLLLLWDSAGDHSPLIGIWVNSRRKLLAIHSHLSLWHVAIRVLANVIGGVHGGKDRL
jgi:hypothetical protein